MAETLLFEDELGTAYFEAFNCYVVTINPIPFSLTVGEKYRVVWDGISYDVEATDGSAVGSEAYVGNGTPFGLDGNDEPFVVLCTSTEAVFVSLTDTESTAHTVAVYHVTEDEETQTVPTIVLKDHTGTTCEYPGIERLRVDTADGGTAVFVDSALIPESVETTIDLDEIGFASGMVEITPEDGQTFSKVNVPVPANLTPGNIAKGVDIAGIVGTFVGGGNIAPVYKSGYFIPSANSTGYTVTHDLGVLPDIAVVIASCKTITELNIITGVFGVSSALADKGCQGLACSTRSVLGVDAGMERSSTMMSRYGAIRNATETTFTCGGSTWLLGSGIDYEWVVIGGLT